MSKPDLTKTIEESCARVVLHLATAAPVQPEDCTGRPFAEALIAHYESSIKSARLMKRWRSDDLLCSLADDIIASHQRDLEMLQEWLRSCREMEVATPITCTE